MSVPVLRLEGGLVDVLRDLAVVLPVSGDTAPPAYLVLPGSWPTVLALSLITGFPPFALALSLSLLCT